uniref:Uncharacterized protein n=1 Tax=viral metagenome TaxID=1070528 RepID=A0A6C0EBU2_9ZZZZ
MKWEEKIKNWENGIIQTYPSNINKRFFYQTYVCNRNMQNKYKEIFIESNKLENINENMEQLI